jgi:hypothetical protein
LFSLVALKLFLGIAMRPMPITSSRSPHRKPPCKLGSAALIDALWGVGHTMTVAVVGGAIILFGVVILRMLV